MPTGKPNVPKKKPGPRSYKDQCKMPRRARIDKQIRHKLNKKRSNSALATDRYGFNLMWRYAPEEMVAAKVKRPGSFETGNIHKGQMWGWKAECNLTDLKVKKIFFRVIHCGELTRPMADAVRKSLSFAYQLVHSDRDDYPVKRILKNWPSVFTVWSTIDDDTFKKVTPEASTIPDRIPTFDENKTAFTKDWSEEHPWSFVRFCSGCLCANDAFVSGPRPKEDIDRVKKSRDHIVVPGEGQMSTGFVGGRAKTDVTTPWRLWTVCLCPGKHKSPGAMDRWNIDPKTGNPLEPFQWCSTCPVACFQFLQSFPNAKDRRYCKVKLAGTAICKTNEGDIVKFATDWMISQGVCPPESRYSHNSGRRSLARLLSKCQISYADGFEVHADKWQNWQGYQNDCPWSSFDRRQQSTDPDVACKALRTIARHFGRGVPIKQPLDTASRYIHNFMKITGHGQLADRIRQGISDDEEEVHPSLIKPEAAGARPSKRIKTEPTEPFQPVQAPKLEAPSQKVRKKPTLGQRLKSLPKTEQIDWSAIGYPPLPPAPQLDRKAKRTMFRQAIRGPRSRQPLSFMGPMPLPPVGWIPPPNFSMPIMPPPPIYFMPPSIMPLPPIPPPVRMPSLFGIPQPERKKRKREPKP